MLLLAGRGWEEGGEVGHEDRRFLWRGRRAASEVRCGLVRSDRDGGGDKRDPCQEGEGLAWLPSTSQRWRRSLSVRCEWTAPMSAPPTSVLPGLVIGGSYRLDVERRAASPCTAGMHAGIPHVAGRHGAGDSGRDQRGCPPVDYYSQVLFPLLARMGYDVDLQLEKGASTPGAEGSRPRWLPAPPWPR